MAFHSQLLATLPMDNCTVLVAIAIVTSIIIIIIIMTTVATTTTNTTTIVLIPTNLVPTVMRWCR